MAVYRLNDDLVFPDPLQADAEGLVAVGGDLGKERLLAAYSAGIFPWFIEDGLPYWFSPDPRCIMFPDKVHVSHSMKQLFNQQFFRVTFDTEFEEVIKNCRQIRRRDGSGDSWIDDQFIDAYTNLHRAGFAHSIEVWRGDELAGGLYGVSLGKCFFGESMFSTMSNASKYGFIYLAHILAAKDFSLIDCQVYNPHLESLGAIEIDRVDFLEHLYHSLQYQTLRGNWSELLNPAA